MSIERNQDTVNYKLFLLNTKGLGEIDLCSFLPHAKINPVFNFYAQQKRLFEIS